MRPALIQTVRSCSRSSPAPAPHRQPVPLRLIRASPRNDARCLPVLPDNDLYSRDLSSHRLHYIGTSSPAAPRRPALIHITRPALPTSSAPPRPAEPLAASAPLLPRPTSARSHRNAAHRGASEVTRKRRVAANRNAAARRPPRHTPAAHHQPGPAPQSAAAGGPHSRPHTTTSDPTPPHTSPSIPARHNTCARIESKRKRRFKHTKGSAPWPPPAAAPCARTPWSPGPTPAPRTAHLYRHKQQTR